MYKILSGLLMLFAIALTACDNTIGGYEEGTKLTVMYNQSSLRSLNIEVAVVDVNDALKKELITTEGPKDIGEFIPSHIIKGTEFTSSEPIVASDYPYIILLHENDIYHDEIQAIDIAKARQSMFYKSSTFSRLLEVTGNPRTPHDFSNFDIPALIALSDKADTPDWTQFLMFIQAYQAFKDSVGNLTPAHVTPEVALKYLAAINAFKATSSPIITNLTKEVIRLNQHVMNPDHTTTFLAIDTLKHIYDMGTTLSRISIAMKINPVAIDDSLNVKKALYDLTLGFVTGFETVVQTIPESNPKASEKRIQDLMASHTKYLSTIQAEATAIQDRMAYINVFKKNTNTAWIMRLETGAVFDFKINEYNPETGNITITMTEPRGKVSKGVITKFVSDHIIAIKTKIQYRNATLDIIFDEGFKTFSGRFTNGYSFDGTLQPKAVEAELAPTEPAQTK